MGLQNFIANIWTARVLANLHKAQVYGQAGVVNRDYEGEIRAKGDTVRINAIGAVTVGDYTKDSNIGDPETLTDAQTTLVIDKAKYFNFQIDDVDKAQGNPAVMDEAMREAAYALSDAQDAIIAAAMAAGAHTSNLIGSTASPKQDLGTASVPYNYLVDLGVLLDQQNVPKSGRFAVVPPWFEGLLRKDVRFTGYGTPQQMDMLMNGIVGMAAGFRLLVSNNVPYTTTTTKFKIVAGHMIATSMAEQINSVEAYRPEKRFADAVKGLHLYGVKVVRPQALAVLTADKPS